MDALARKFHETHDMNVPDEIYRLAGEYGKADRGTKPGQLSMDSISLNRLASSKISSAISGS
jgi:hypothetical protein